LNPRSEIAVDLKSTPFDQKSALEWSDRPLELGEQVHYMSPNRLQLHYVTKRMQERSITYLC